MSDSAFVSRCDHRCVGAESLRHFSVTVTWGECLVAEGFLFLASSVKLFVSQSDVDGSCGNVDFDNVAVPDKSDIAAVGSFGRNVANGET